MELKDKINLLSNSFAVTEEGLYEALLLDKPHVLDVDLYLSIQTVLIHSTGNSPKTVLNFINTILKRIDISDGFENTMYRIFYRFKLRNKNERLLYLAEIFGKYQLSLAITLMNSIDVIEELKYKIE